MEYDELESSLEELEVSAVLELEVEVVELRLELEVVELELELDDLMLEEDVCVERELELNGELLSELLGALDDVAELLELLEDLEEVVEELRSTVR